MRWFDNVLVNDLYSFRKEIIQCDRVFKRCQNLIALYVNLENLSLQESVDKLHKQIIETDNQVLEIVDALRQEYSNSKHMNIFFDEFLGILGGNWLFLNGLKRYQGKNLKGFIPLSGRFVFSENVTKIIPDKGFDENWSFLKKYFIKLIKK